MVCNLVKKKFGFWGFDQMDDSTKTDLLSIWCFYPHQYSWKDIKFHIANQTIIFVIRMINFTILCRKWFLIRQDVLKININYFYSKIVRVYFHGMYNLKELKIKLNEKCQFSLPKPNQVKFLFRIKQSTFSQFIYYKNFE